MSSSSIIVGVRVRPFNSREANFNPKCIVHMDTNATYLQVVRGGKVVQDEKPREFFFDYAFWTHSRTPEEANIGAGPGSSSSNLPLPPYSDQASVFQLLGQPIVANVVNGFNACIFAYGQTGSGKTYSMMGAPSDPGVLPRMSDALYASLVATAAAASTATAPATTAPPAASSFRVECSFCEIYNEAVRDLLSEGKNVVQVRQHPQQGIFVQGITTVATANSFELCALLDKALASRSVTATKMNSTSSRSHAVVLVRVVQSDGVLQRTSRLSVVDLAGSERAESTGATGSTMVEAQNINSSLSVLGMCLSRLADLAEGRTGLHVPFRDSQLTFLLSESLGGNSKTSMLAAISPAAVNFEETLSTLRFAQVTKRVKTVAVVNESATTRQIRELKGELAELRSKLTQLQQQAVIAGPVAHSDPTVMADAAPEEALVVVEASTFFQSAPPVPSHATNPTDDAGDVDWSQPQLICLTAGSGDVVVLPIREGTHPMQLGDSDHGITVTVSCCGLTREVLLERHARLFVNGEPTSQVLSGVIGGEGGVGDVAAPPSSRQLHQEDGSSAQSSHNKTILKHRDRVVVTSGGGVPSSGSGGGGGTASAAYRLSYPEMKYERHRIVDVEHANLLEAVLRQEIVQQWCDQLRDAIASPVREALLAIMAAAVAATRCTEPSVEPPPASPEEPPSPEEPSSPDKQGGMRAEHVALQSVTDSVAAISDLRGDADQCRFRLETLLLESYSIDPTLDEDDGSGTSAKKKDESDAAIAEVKRSLSEKDSLIERLRAEIEAAATVAPTIEEEEDSGDDSVEETEVSDAAAKAVAPPPTLAVPPTSGQHQVSAERITQIKERERQLASECLEKAVQAEMKYHRDTRLLREWKDVLPETATQREQLLFETFKTATPFLADPSLGIERVGQKVSLSDAASVTKGQAPFKDVCVALTRTFLLWFERFDGPAPCLGAVYLVGAEIVVGGAAAAQDPALGDPNLLVQIIPAVPRYKGHNARTGSDCKATLKLRTKADVEAWTAALSERATPVPPLSLLKRTLIGNGSRKLGLVGEEFDPKKLWIPDDYATACAGCGTKFSFFHRRHHCRSCGEVFDSACLISKQCGKCRSACTITAVTAEVEAALSPYAPTNVVVLPASDVLLGTKASLQRSSIIMDDPAASSSTAAAPPLPATILQFRVPLARTYDFAFDRLGHCILNDAVPQSSLSNQQLLDSSSSSSSTRVAASCFTTQPGESGGAVATFLDIEEPRGWDRVCRTCRFRRCGEGGALSASKTESSASLLSASIPAIVRVDLYTLRFHIWCAAEVVSYDRLGDRGVMLFLTRRRMSVLVLAMPLHREWIVHALHILCGRRIFVSQWPGKASPESNATTKGNVAATARTATATQPPRVPAATAPTATPTQRPRVTAVKSVPLFTATAADDLLLTGKPVERTASLASASSSSAPTVAPRGRDRVYTH